MAQYTPVTHVIFDMDGLVLDTEIIYDKVLTALCAKYNKVLTDELRLKVMGTIDADCARIIVEGLGIPLSFEEFTKEQKEEQAKVLGVCGFMPGAVRLIKHLHSKGIPIAVATSSSLSSVEIKIARHKELFSLFHHITSGTSDPDVKNGKPSPDIFLVCASRFPDQPSPEKCLVFEDAPNGVKGARAAGMQAIMVPAPTTPEDRRQEATLVLTSLLDFKPEMFGLPPLPDCHCKS